MPFFEIKKVYTENPYADELIYFVKTLALDTVLKNEQKALYYETESSLRNSALYLMCVNNRMILTSFRELDFETCRKALDDAGYDTVDNYDLATWCADPSTLSTDSIYYSIILQAQRQYFIDNYVEENEYYRMIAGLPPLGDDPIYVDSAIVDESIMYDYSKPLHEQSDVILQLLESKGVLEKLYNEDPEERSWILHLTRKIQPYYARRAAKFEALYIPYISSDAISSMYKDKLEANRIYVMRTMYSEAYKYRSDYYDNIIAIFIVLNTMIDIISRINEFITRKEIFDIRSCKYLFQSYGVEFFEEIPLRYQIRMIKNIHTLIKYKSTSKCMLNICSLFGFDNISIFKYYLLKDKTIDNDTESIDYNDKWITIDNTVVIETDEFTDCWYVRDPEVSTEIGEYIDIWYSYSNTQEPDKSKDYIDPWLTYIPSEDDIIDLSEYTDKWQIYDPDGNGTSVIHKQIDKWQTIDPEDYDDTNMNVIDAPMKFVRLPIDGKADDYLRNTTNYREYDAITIDDLCWDGGLEHKEVKKQIFDLEFNYTRTKYYSIDSMYDLYKIIVGQTYFYNMLYDNKIYEENLTVTLPSISTEAKFRLADCFIMIEALMYRIRGMKDMLMDTEGKILYIYGFDFSQNMADLREKVYRTRKEVGNPDGDLFEVDSVEVLKTGKCGDDISYTLYNTGELKIEGVGEMYDYRYMTEGDLKETPWHYNRKKIIKVTLSEGITRIGNFAFADLVNMTSVNIPSTITHIGDYAFWGCNSVGTIYVPRNVVVGEYAFGGNPCPLQQGSTTALEIVDPENGFIIPTEEIPSIIDFMNIYVNNVNAMDRILNEMYTADDYHTFNIYKDLYESLCIEELTMDFFCNPETGDYYRDTEGDATFTEFLKHRNALFYNMLCEIDSSDDKLTEGYIGNIIDTIIYGIEEYINSKEFAEIFANINKDAVLRYIRMVINFFKSYKIELLGVNVVYTFESNTEGYVSVIDDMWYNRKDFTKTELINAYDTLGSYTSKLTKSQSLDLMERLYMDISRWKYMHLPTYLRLRDQTANIMTNMTGNDSVMIKESIDMNVSYTS